MSDGTVKNTGNDLIMPAGGKIKTLTAGSASGEAVEYDQLNTAVATGSTDNRVLRADGTGGHKTQNSPVSISDAGVVSGLAAPLAATDAPTRAYVDLAVVVARVVTTSALAAYTYANGTAGVGATITANANGALAAVDGVTLVAGDLLLLQNGAAFADNGLYVVTTVGDGSNPFVLTRDVRGDTQAKILSSTIKISEGNSRRGAIYEYINDPSITMGTTKLAWIRVDNRRTANEYYSNFTDFDQQTTGSPAANTVMAGPFGGFIQFANGTAAITVAASTATEKGVFSFTTGNSATGTAAITFSATNPPLFWNTNDYIELNFRFADPNAVSTGSERYRMMIGLSQLNTVAGTDGVWIEHTDTTDATHWLAVTRTGSSSTATVGPAISTTTYSRWRIWKYAGETTVHFSQNGTEIGTGNTTNQPTGVALTPLIIITKSIGSTARSFTIDSYGVSIATPNGRSA